MKVVIINQEMMNSVKCFTDGFVMTWQTEDQGTPSWWAGRRYACVCLSAEMLIKMSHAETPTQTVAFFPPFNGLEKQQSPANNSSLNCD